MTQRKQTTPVPQRLAVRPRLHFGFLLMLALVPVAVYAGAITGLNTFVKGEVADADQVNENFSALQAAVDDNNGRITTIEGLMTQSCPAGEFMNGVDGSGAITCLPLPEAMVVATSLPETVFFGEGEDPPTTPPCPSPTVVVAAGMRASPLCAPPSCGCIFLSSGGWAVRVSPDGASAFIDSTASAIDTSDCEIFAVCR